MGTRKVSTKTKKSNGGKSSGGLFMQMAFGAILLACVFIFVVVHFTHSQDLARHAAADEAADVAKTLGWKVVPQLAAGGQALPLWDARAIDVEAVAGRHQSAAAATAELSGRAASAASLHSADEVGTFNSVADTAGSPHGAGAAAPQEAASANSVVTSSATRVTWKLHTGKSCQGYADGESTERNLEDSKIKCLAMDSCVGIECVHGSSNSCSLRATANFVPFEPADCYERFETDANGEPLTSRVHPDYNKLLREYPFQQVTTQSGTQVNVILVRSQMNPSQKRMMDKYKDDILFIGISSMNDYPLNDDGKCTEFCTMYPGFLYMMRDPETKFPPSVKTLLMSQSDFSLPNFPARDHSVPKKYDFTFSGSDCDVASDCSGWCGWSKNISFVREALKLMCNEPYKLKGVLVATKDKANKKACSIPPECAGLIIQTTYLQKQDDYFDYLKQSKFAFLPQVHDASPRVSTQALSLDVPILMNWHIRGGWKYVNEKTGEFFHDMSDFRQALDKILKGSDTPHYYEPRKWALENLGNVNSGKRLLEFVKSFNKVTLPKGTKYLLT